MPKALDKAQAQYRSGQHKKAADTLWEVSFGGEDAEAEARSVVALARTENRVLRRQGQVVLRG